MKTKENRLDMYHFCSFYENAMESLIICAKVYFPVSELFFYIN